MSRKKKSNYAWMAWVTGFFAVSYFCSNSSGGSPSSPEYPNDPQPFAYEYQNDMAETDPRILTAEADPCIRYGACDDFIEPDDGYHDYLFEQEQQSANTDSPCPSGCTSYVSGCDIKGNISFNSGEKIYHVPGQKYYDSTIIEPAYGERWFCTEAEARTNGWRRSFE